MRSAASDYPLPWSAPQLDDPADRPAPHDGLDVVSPTLQPGALFVGVVVPLINADDAAKRAAAMVEHLLDHRQLDAEPGHAGCRRPPQIMPDERLLRLHDLVDGELDAREVPDRPGAVSREDDVADVRHLLDQL